MRRSNLSLPNRKIKAHKKSRRGCGNCKIRAVKCDESKPRCQKCAAFGVFCNYDSKCSDLQLSADGAFNSKSLNRSPSPLKQAIPRIIDPSLRLLSTVLLGSNSSYQLGRQDLGLLNKFRSRTVFTVTIDKSLRSYHNDIIKLACSHSFLMHAVLSVTLMYDRFLSDAPHAKLSYNEVFHWNRGITLFNNKLSGPIQPSERDALWATAAILGAIAFCYMEAKTPEEAWPLRPPSPLDLNWLKMRDGRNEVWNITQPSTANSVFQTLALENPNPVPPSARIGLETLPPKFIALYGLDAISNPDNNPYRSAAVALAQLLNIDCKISIIQSFLGLIGDIRPDYKRLLMHKDPRALLLLAWSYAKVCQHQRTWVVRRAGLECQAICIYLERYYRHEYNIQELLHFPKTMCGIVGTTAYPSLARTLRQSPSKFTVMETAANTVAC